MAALRLVCVVALCRASFGLRRWPSFYTPKPYVEPQPAFYACDGDGAEVAGGCPPSFPSPSRTMDSLLKSGYSRLKAVDSLRKYSRNAGVEARPMLVFVGAGALRSSAPWSNSQTVEKILWDCGVSRNRMHMAFVDPLGEDPDFWDKVGRLGMDTSSVSRVNAVLDERCAGKTQLFRLSPQAASELGPGNSSSTAGLSFAPPMQDSSEGLGEEADLTESVEVQVACRAPLDVIRDMGALLDNIGIMFIDAEGMSLQGLLPLLTHRDFQAGFVMWKSGDDPQEVELRKHFRKRGYEIGVKPVGADAAQGYGGYVIATKKTKPK